MRDLENGAQYDAVARFAAAMRSVREHLSQAGKLHYKYQKEAWLLDAVDLYCQGVERLRSDLRGTAPFSLGLLGFFGYLDGYVGSPAFQNLLSEIAALREKLSSICYTLLIGDGAITISAHHDESDYGAEIQADFEKFKQGAAGDHIFKFRDFEQMNHIEAGVLDRIAWLNPAIFAQLDDLSARSSSLFDRTVLRFDREAQFYVAYIAHMRHFTGDGLTFCYPRMSPESKEVHVTEGYDLALAKIHRW
jgi:DNA mismatch repair protein MutS